MPYNRNIYTADFRKLANWLVPEKWRRPKLLTWARAMAAPIVDLYSLFSVYRSRVKYELLITPQVCYLEKSLNDKYDPIQRRIFIDDGAENLPTNLYTRDEVKPLYLFRRSENKPVYLRSRTETAEFGVDFVVNVPASVQFNEPELRTFLNSYKLATKTFQIVTF